MSVTDTNKDTATRILDAAEVLFVEHGFEATSLRMITQRAEVNLAAVNYHFGSKEVLFQGVVGRRLAPYNQECVQELERAQQEQGETALDVMGIVSAFLRPALRMAKDPAKGGLMFIRLMSRVFSEPHQALREMLPRHYQAVLEAYSTSLKRALPHLSTEEVLWRLHFALGTVFYAFAGNDVVKLFMKSHVPGARDPQQVVSHLLPYVVAGLTAPGQRQSDVGVVSPVMR
ncbi:AcrR family transcriptional regulator [Chitinivorax tropicus]|uniref:AcrR family transcriptional regulator n=1 Tax=Chitinivorax tropicus TaxID=714531 RepID=A0A840MR32_9PROT|nr:TetR/AcrR family transcriptional regulator [Chitinivorax tropicus]MBB5018663.1 AcrR family transcriptional regulator [Chitinivorax tropicus]